MPKNARVTLCYGPYESNGAVERRSFRLQGLQGMLLVSHPNSDTRVLSASWNFLAEAKHCPSNMSAAALRARGHQCVLEETRERNTVELVVNGVIVFTCRVKQLQFGE